jgi:antitoxin YefM
MAIETTYTHLRQNLAAALDRVAENHETVIVRRRNASDVALVEASELAGLIETAHLLRSSRNAQRLLAALGRARHGKGRVTTAARLRAQLRLDSGRS